MFDEAVGHLVKREADLFQADLLADDIKWRGRKAVVHRAHHTRQYRAVADAGVEHTHRRRTWMNVGELEIDARCALPFLRAGVHEQQIFLAVVEETKIALRVVSGESRSDGWRRRFYDRQHSGRSWLEQHAAARRRAVEIARHERTDALECVRCDAATIAQAVRQFAVVHGAAAEGRLGEPARAAKFADLLEDLFVHRGVP